MQSPPAPPPRDTGAGATQDENIPPPPRGGGGAPLRRLIGLDFHIVQTLLLRGWSIVAGAVMALLVPFWFNRVEQGYYYTLLSLIAVQIFFELGMNQIIVQLVSHEAAHLRQDSDGKLAGDHAAITRLASLIALITRWYRVAAILFFIVGGAAGAMFFYLQQHQGIGKAIGVWLGLVLFTSFNLYLSPSLATLEGFGEIGKVARVRMVQSVLGYVIMWIALTAGAGLLATPLLAATGTVVTAYWLMRHDRRVRWLRSVRIAPGDATLSWQHDVFPLQWRIALSWISGYLILQILVPMAFAHQGPVAAGQLGLTLTIFNSLLTIGLSWVNARLPVMAAHLARREGAAARQIFWGVILRSVGVTTLGCLAVCIGLLVLPASMRGRFADNATVFCLVLSTAVNCAVYAMATFVRAHKEEPLMVQSLVTALIMVPTIFLGSRIGILAMMAGFAAVMTLVALPWVIVIFRRYYHREY